MKYRQRPVEVDAFRIVGVVAITVKGKMLTLEDGSARLATHPMLSHYANPGPGDYYVVDHSGVVTITPKYTFEREYGPVA